MRHEVIAGVFNELFLECEHTRLVGGAPEPFYEPPSHVDGCRVPGRLHYREDFAASALHEAAHWCIAGRRRRKLEDFGYAYCPPPRDMRQQAAFYACELRAQTLECLFSEACGIDFRPSADDLQANESDFAVRIQQRVAVERVWLDTPGGRRAKYFIAALRRQRVQPAQQVNAAVTHTHNRETRCLLNP